MSQRRPRTASFFILVILFCIAPSAVAQVDVWIDPGHGGDDPGNLGISGDPAKYEKNIALQVSNLLHSRLGQLGFSSFLTRTGDIFWTLEERAWIASGLRRNQDSLQAVGQMVVCVHMNAWPDTNVIGTETYYARRKRYSKRLDSYRVDSTYAAAVHTNMMSQAPLAFLGCHSNRGVKKAGFQVIKDARVPGVYVEVCFLTNRCQQDRIAVQGNQALIANGIAAGIGQVISPGGFLATIPSASGSTAHLPRFDEASREPLPNRGAPAVQLLQEDFESASFPPSGWTTLSQGLPIPHQWHRAVAPLYAHGGAAAARVGAESPSAIDEWLISPLTLLGGSDTGLRFYWNGNRQFAQSVNAECLIRPSGSGTWTQLWSPSN